MPTEPTRANNWVEIHDTPFGLPASRSVFLVHGDADPSVAGRAAPVGSRYGRTSNGDQYTKYGPADTDWRLLESGTTFVTPPSLIVNSTNTGTADSHIPTTATTYEWTVTVKDNVTGAYKSSKVLGIYDGTAVTHTVYQNVGSSAVKRKIDVVLNAGTVELNVTNNGPNPVTVKVSRSPMIET
jgi:hypothetical protein